MIPAHAHASRVEIWEFGFVIETHEDYESGNGARLFTRESDQRLTGLLYSHEEGVYALEIEEHVDSVSALLKPKDKRLPEINLVGESRHKSTASGQCVRELRFEQGATFLVMHSSAKKRECR
jgi:hypothetical protein